MTAAPHWTDRAADETLGDYIRRLYEAIPDKNWHLFDERVADCVAKNEPVPPMIETLWSLRKLEEADTTTPFLGPLQ